MPHLPEYKKPICHVGIASGKLEKSHIMVRNNKVKFKAAFTCQGNKENYRR